MSNLQPITVNPNQCGRRSRNRGLRIGWSKIQDGYFHLEGADSSATPADTGKPQGARFRVISVVLISAALLVLAGCGAGGFAQESPWANAFMNQVQTACGKLSIGRQQIGWLLGPENNDTTFLDATGKLYSGQFSRSDYSDYINAFYATDNNQPALNCIFKQL